MSRAWTRLACLTWAALSAASAAAADSRRAGYPLSPVPFTMVRLTDSFWARRLETNRSVTIPFGFRKSEEEGRIRTSKRAARVQRGQPESYEGKMPFDELDLVVPDEARLAVERRSQLLGGLAVVRGPARSAKGEPRELAAIPYYAWSHRGPGLYQNTPWSFALEREAA